MSLPVTKKHMIYQTIERLLGSLSSHEQRMRQRGKSSNSEYPLQSKANVSNHRGYYGDRGRGRGQAKSGNYSSYNRNKIVESNSTVGQQTTSSADWDKSKIQCHRCD